VDGPARARGVRRAHREHPERGAPRRDPIRARLRGVDPRRARRGARGLEEGRLAQGGPLHDHDAHEPGARAPPRRPRLARHARRHACLVRGQLGSGPSVPGDRFVCGDGSFVGVTVIRDLSDAPRRCLYAPPGGNSHVLRVAFANVTFGGALHGHAGIQNENERFRAGAPVTLSFRAGDRVLGKVVHHDGDGWKGFELSTTDLAGKQGELVAELTSTERSRQYCFEADTR
jgi:hypothetical protein